MKNPSSLNFIPTLNFLMRSRFLRAFVSICMIVQSTPMASAANVPEVLPGSVAPKSIQELAIPKDMGTATEIFRGQSWNTIVCIEDAHSVTDAQENIQKMIGHLQTNYGISLFAVEGSFGKFDPTLYRTFPDAERKEKVFSADLARSEITGAESAALLNEKEAMFYGIEDWELYTAHFKTYLKASSVQKELLNALGRVQEGLRQKRDATFSDSLKKFHQVLEDFYEEKASLAELLAEMIPHQRFLGGDKEYEELSRMMSAAASLQKAEDPALRAQITAMAQEMKKQYLGKMDLKTQMRFYASLQGFATGQIDSSGFLLELVRLAQPFGYRPRLTSVMKELLGHAVTLSRIRGGKAFGALESSVMRIEESLSTSPSERDLIGEYHRLFFMKDLVRLRLSRPQFRLFAKNPGAYTGSFDDVFRNAVGPAVEYYRIALKRDQAFFSRLEKVMRETKQNVAGVVLGGFHTQGLTDLLREKKISFAVMTPRMGSLKGQEFYGKVMQGDLSYRKDLKTSFYDGYARATVRKLVEGYDVFALRRVLVLWREGLIRTLSAEGRVADFHRYAPYFDEVLKNNPSSLSSFQEQKTGEAIFSLAEKELEQSKKETLEKIGTRFQSQLRAFTAGLNELFQQKRMTETAVDALYKRISNPQASFLNFPTNKLIFEAPGRGDLVFEFMAGNRGALPAPVSHSSEVGQRTVVPEQLPTVRSETRSQPFLTARPAFKTNSFSGFYRQGFFLLKIAAIMALLTVRALGAQVRLAWDSPTNNADGTVITDLAGFKVYGGEASSNYTHIWNAGNTNDFLVTNLVMGITYYFTATAYNTAQVESEYATPELTWTAPFPAPSGLAVSVQTGGNASLNWQAMGDLSVTGYRIRHVYPDGREEQTDVGKVENYVWNGAVTELGIHSFTIAGINSRGTEGEKSAAVRYVTDVIPQTPVLSAVTSAPGVITLQWNAQTGIAGYKVLQGEVSGTYPQMWNVGNTNRFQMTNAVSGVTYYFTARAYNTKGEESAAAQELTYMIPLLAPANFRFTDVTGQSITLSWEATADESVTGYRIRHTYPDGREEQIDLGDVTSHTWAGVLTDLGAHSFTIAGMNSRGTAGEESGAVTYAVDVVPQTPVLSAVTSAPGVITLQWNAQTGIAGYKVLQGEVSGTYPQMWNVGNTNRFQMTNAVSGVTYYFTARAYNTKGEESAAAQELTYMIPLLAPANFRITKVKANNATFAWNASVDPSVTGYRIYHGMTQGNYPDVMNVGKVTQVTWSKILAAQGTHYFVIASINTRGIAGQISPVISRSTGTRTAAALSETAPVTTPLRIEATDGNIRLRFSSIAGTDYEIQWTEDLVSNFWTSLEVISGTGEEIVWEEMMQGDRGFYRVLLQDANTVSVEPRSEMRAELLTDGLAQITSQTDLLRDVSYFVGHGRRYWLYDLRQVNGEMNVDLIASPAEWHQRLQRNDVLTYRRHELDGFYFKSTMTQVKGQRVKENAGVLMATNTVKGIWDAIEKIRPAGISAKTLQKMDSALHLQARKYRIPLIPFWKEEYPDLAAAKAGIKKHIQNEARHGKRLAFARSLREALSFFRMNEEEWRQYFRNEIRAQEEALAEQRVLNKVRPNETLPAWPQTASWQQSFDAMQQTISYLAGISNSSAWVLDASEKPVEVRWGEWSSHLLSTPLTLLNAGYYFYQKGMGRKFVLEGSLTIVDSLEQRLEEASSGIAFLSEMAKRFSKDVPGESQQISTQDEKGRSPEKPLRRNELFRYFSVQVFTEDFAGKERRKKFVQAVRVLEKGYREIAQQTEKIIADLENYIPRRAAAMIYPNSALKEGMLVRLDGGEYWIYDVRSFATKGSLTLWKARRNHALREEDRKIVQRQELDGASVVKRGTNRLTLREVEVLLAQLPVEARNKKSLSEGPYADPKLYYAVVTYRYPLPASLPTVERQEEMEIDQPPAEMTPEVFRSPFTAWIPIRSKDLSRVPADQWFSLESEWERLGRKKMETLSAEIDQGNASVRNFLKDNVYLVFTLDAERFGILSGGLPDAPQLLNRLKGLTARHSFLRVDAQALSPVSLESLTQKARFLLEHPEAFDRAYRDWQRANAASVPAVLSRVEATVLDAAFLSALGNSREAEKFCAVKLAAGDRLVLAYDRKKTPEERIVRSLLSKFIRIVPFAYFYGLSGREISDRNLAKQIGPVSYVALFPVSASLNIKAPGNSALVERSALADETFIKKVVESGVSLDHIFSIVRLGLLRGQLEDKGCVLKELTPQSFNRIVQFLNMLAEAYKAGETLERAA